MKRRRNQLISVIMVLGLGLLTGCDSVDPGETLPKKTETTDEVTEPFSEVMTGVGIMTELHPIGTDEVESAEEASGTETEFEEESKVMDSPEVLDIADRVVKRFENQCLEIHYSDYQLRVMGGSGTQKYDRSSNFEPGTKLYYQIYCNENAKLFQVRCSDQEDFEPNFAWEYVYYLDGKVKQTRKQETEFDYFVTSGEFTVPESFSISDEETYKITDTVFHKFWDRWISEKSSSELASPVKNAYLMPFSTEEDGTADITVYMEEENGTWIMARACVSIDSAEAEKIAALEGDLSKNKGLNSSITWRIPDINSEYQLILWNMGRGYHGELEEYIADLDKPSDLFIRRAYVPGEADYQVLEFESFSGFDFFNSEGKRIVQGTHGFLPPENGDFLTRIPELALEKLY